MICDVFYPSILTSRKFSKDDFISMSCYAHVLLFYYLYSQRDMSEHQAVLDTPQETREYLDTPLTPGRTPSHRREDGKPAKRLKTTRVAESQGDRGEMARLRGQSITMPTFLICGRPHPSSDQHSHSCSSGRMV